MRVLVLEGLELGKHKRAAQKIIDAIERDDFRSADVKKLSDRVHYRARLDYENRLLLRFVQHEGAKCCFVVDLIEAHRYERSRFLRGVKIDLDEAAVEAAPAPDVAFEPVRYVHPSAHRFRFLDRPLSFDDAQESALDSRPPLLMLGSAGSGKTAVSLLRLRAATGTVAYVTQSPYLAEAARSLYFHAHEEPEDRNVAFLSFRDLLATLAPPNGRPVRLQDFRGFFERHRQKVRFADAHRVFEELRGVLGAQPEGPLSKAAYRELGVRQSIFRGEERDAIWDLFESYRAWLAEAKLYDSNLVAHALLEAPREPWDFVLVDEVQDFTNVELALVLRGLRDPRQFVLTGDANQIVHPNFFSWSNLRGMFFRGADAAGSDAAPVTAPVHVLPANYRNASEIVAVANRLLMLKRARFGSVDRESDLLSEPRADEPGSVRAYPSTDATARALNDATQRSTKACVIVLRDEDREAAKARYRTPLVFAVHEAKGLEYETVILHELVSTARAEFREVCAGVSQDDLRADRAFSRAKDKDDKSLEIYKFFTNALFVAITRGISRVVFVEKDAQHPIFVLLGIAFRTGAVDLARDVGSLEEWQREARKLELQGKQEQADAIRKQILKIEPVPWAVMSADKKAELEHKAINQGEIFKKAKQQLWDIATFYDDAPLGDRLGGRLDYRPQQAFGVALKAAQGRNQPSAYASNNPAEVLRLVDKHGVDLRTFMNLTPLMHGCYAGNVGLVEQLVGRGADVRARDTYGRTALHWLLHRAAAVEGERIPTMLVPDQTFIDGPFATLFDRVAEPTIDVQVDGRLVRIGREQGEYLLFQLICAFGRQLTYRNDEPPDTLVRAAALEPLIEVLPETVLPERRRKRAYTNGVFARSEVSSTYATSRRLWERRRQGHYEINAALSLRVSDDAFVPAVEVLGIRATQGHLLPVGVTPIVVPASGHAKAKRIVPAGLGPGPDVPASAYVGLEGAGPAYDHAAYDRDVALALPSEAGAGVPRAERVAAAARLFDHASAYFEKIVVERIVREGFAWPDGARGDAREIKVDPLGYLVEQHDAETIERVVRATLEEPVNRRGISALHTAALIRNVELVKALVDAGVPRDIRDFYGATPLDHVLASYRIESDSPGVSLPLIELLAPPSVTFQTGAAPVTAPKGTDAYALCLLLTATLRPCASNNFDWGHGEWGLATAPMDLLSDCLQFFGGAIFPAASTMGGYLKKALALHSVGGPGYALCTVDRNGVGLNRQLRVPVGERMVPFVEVTRLDVLRKLAAPLRR